VKYLVMTRAGSFEVAVDGERVTVEGVEGTAHLSLVPGTPVRHLLMGNRSVSLGLEAGAPGKWAVTRHGVRWEVAVIDERARHMQDLTLAEQLSPVTAALCAPMPGLIVRVAVEPGNRVVGGEGLVVLEAMKMENELRAPAAAIVKAIRVEAGQAVEKGQVLVEFEES